MICTLYTARIGVKDPDALDITVKSANTPLGMLLAPSWSMVEDLKYGRITQDEYRQRYFARQRVNYMATPEVFVSLLHRPRVVLVCYCASGAFCHRHLAVEILTAIGSAVGVEVIDGGEIEPQKPDATQLKLFEV